MDDNIKWLADQNPRAKIIVWAHNGHIVHGGIPSYAPMGSYLRNMLGPQYVNFGFAFNKAAFQAIESGKGLRDFSIGTRSMAASTPRSRPPACRSWRWMFERLQNKLRLPTC